MNNSNEQPQDAEHNLYGISTNQFLFAADRMVARCSLYGFLAPIGLCAFDALSTLSWQRAVPAAIATTATTIYAGILATGKARNTLLQQLDYVCDDEGAFLQDSDMGRGSISYASERIKECAAEVTHISCINAAVAWGAVKATCYSVAATFSSQVDPHAFAVSHPILTWAGTAVLAGYVAAMMKFAPEGTEQYMNSIQHAIRPKTATQRAVALNN